MSEVQMQLQCFVFLANGSSYPDYYIDFRFEVVDGHLLISDGGALIAAYAPGVWSRVEIKSVEINPDAELGEWRPAGGVRL